MYVWYLTIIDDKPKQKRKKNLIKVDLGRA